MTRRPVLICVPDVPERIHMGEMPVNVDLRLVPPAPALGQDIADAELVVPLTETRAAILALLDAGGERLRVIQTLGAGVDWLIGRVPDHVIVCTAGRSYDAPRAEWVTGAILAMERGFVEARDAQARRDRNVLNPPELF